jgi:hypothetical protein
MVRHGLVERAILEQRLAETPVADDRRELIRARSAADFS